MAMAFVAPGCVGRGDSGAATAVATAAAPRERLIRSVATEGGDKHKPGDEVTFSIKPAGGHSPDSVALYMGGRRIGLFSGGKLRWRIPVRHPLGQHSYRAVAYLGEESSASSGVITILAAAPPACYTYRVKRSYPHNTASYTQGLYYEEGYFYEGTGLNGRSALLKVDPATGRTVQSRALDRKYFGEGIARVGDKIYQLTWQSNKALVYDRTTMEPAGEFGYDGEGWGLATDGHNLYMSGGTEEIHVVDPATFKRLATIQAYTDQGPVGYVNEMEWIRGELWANVYTSDRIIRIDPSTGAVTGVVDLAGILPESSRTPDTDVLNGIAYDEKQNRIFITGKNWDTLFEIDVILQKR